MAEYADFQTLPPVRRAPLVGLVGKARAGKDTVAARLGGAGYIRVAFADPLKAAALALDPIVVPGEAFDDPFAPTLRLSDVVLQYGWEVAKDQIPEVRRTLQRLGAAVRDEVDAATWRDKALREADDHEREGFPVVITDVRYRNEAEAITERGGMLVRIIRPGGPGASVAHLSETELDNWITDYQILNDADLDSLRQAADDLVSVANTRLGLH